MKNDYMDFDTIRYHRENNVTLKLLRKDSAPLIISFLFNEFKDKGRSLIDSEELSTRLSDYIYSLSTFSEETGMSGKASAYLDQWAGEGFLRKYYTSGSDVAVFDLTPGTEKAIEWFQELNKKEFIGTESRLLKIFDMLKELVFNSTDDPEKQLSVLRDKRKEIDNQIKAIESGAFNRADDRLIREQFFEIEDTSRKLLSDFRQVEYNFRQLDRDARKKQIQDVSSRGQVLGDFFEIHDLIWDTDQGKSFRAFWEFLMSSDKQEELDNLIGQVISLPEIERTSENTIIEDFKINLVEAGDKVNKTTHQLIDQLRRFLDNNSIGETKRVLSILGEIKSTAFSIKENDPKDRAFLEIDHHPYINNILERPLFTPGEKVSIQEIVILEGKSDESADILFSQHYIDRNELMDRIRTTSSSKGQVSLREIIEKHPVTKGLSEILAYLDIAEHDSRATVDEKEKNVMTLSNSETGKMFRIRIPAIIFNRRE